MPAQTAASGLLASLGARAAKAHAASKDKEVVVGSNARLPAGINNGVAQVVQVQFGKYKAGDHTGKPFFMASAVVVFPEYFNGPNGREKIAGRRTSIGPIPLCDTPKATNENKRTFEANWDEMENELKKLGVPVAKLGVPQLEAAALALNVSKPFTNFETFAGKKSDKYPEPRTFERWTGKTEFDPDAAGAGADGAVEDAGESLHVDATEDETGGEPEAEGGDALDFDALGTAADGGDKDAIRAIMSAGLEAGFDKDTLEAAATWAEAAAMVAAGAPEGGEPEAEAEGETDWSASEDYAAMGEAGDNGDQAAADRLTEVAESFGLDPNDYGPWADLATAVAEAAGGDEPEVAWEPAKGGTALYKAGPKAKPVEVEILALFPGKRQANVKNLATDAIIKMASYETLSEIK